MFRRWSACGIAALVTTALGVVGAAGCGGSDPKDRTIEVDLTAIEIGSYKLRSRPRLSEAIAEFGAPDDCRLTPVTKYAEATWRDLGLTIFAGRLSAVPGGKPPCDAPQHVFVRSIRITGREWKTDAGLRVGDSDDRVGDLYPRARRGPRLRAWWLVVDLADGHGFRPAPALLATTRGGHVRSFLIEVRGEGI